MTSNSEGMDNIKLIMFSWIALDSLSWHSHTATFRELSDYRQREQSEWETSKRLSVWLLEQAWELQHKPGELRMGAASYFYMAMAKIELLYRYLSAGEQDELCDYLIKRKCKIAP